MKTFSNVSNLLPCPAVSIIIPIYNAEKYISKCLDSIFEQTFQDFEVIVVDDCSIDNSVAIVENYRKKFGEQMIFTQTKKNSGNAGYTARNKGFKFARGEYVFFVDADDFISKTALEELYTLAKKYSADVVYTGARYRYTVEEGAILTRDRIGKSFQVADLQEKPTLTINDPNKNLQELLDLKRGIYHTPWTKFVKRNFLIEKGIAFYKTISGGDYLWTIELFASAERFLRIPNAVYYWRDDSLESMTRSKSSTEIQIRKWGKIFISFTKALTALSDKIEILKENPAYTYSALKFWIDFCLKHYLTEKVQLNSIEVYKILCHEFTKENVLYDLMAPFFLSVVDSQEKDLLAAQRRIAELERRDKENKAYIAEL